MKTKITPVANNWVTVSYTDAVTDARINFEAYAPLKGGYVRDEHGNQICDELACRGNTLMWSGKVPLVELMRREYRRMRAAERREEKRSALV